MKQFIGYFLLFFVTGFILGLIHAKHDNLEKKDHDSLVENIIPRMRIEYEKGDTTSYLIYRCQNANAYTISFNDLTKKTDPFIKFTEKKIILPFVSFDRIYSTVGAGILMSWGIKDVVLKGTSTKNKPSFIAAVIGAISGYSLGYNLFRTNKIECNSSEINALFQKKEEVEMLKKRFIAQTLLNDIVIIQFKNSKKPLVTLINRLSFKELVPLMNLTFYRDSILHSDFIRIEKKHRMSFEKFTSDSCKHFTTIDLLNIIERSTFWESILTQKKFWKDNIENITYSPFPKLESSLLKEL